MLILKIKPINAATVLRALARYPDSQIPGLMCIRALIYERKTISFLKVIKSSDKNQI